MCKSRKNRITNPHTLLKHFWLKYFKVNSRYHKMAHSSIHNHKPIIMPKLLINNFLESAYQLICSQNSDFLFCLKNVFSQLAYWNRDPMEHSHRICTLYLLRSPASSPHPTHPPGFFTVVEKLNKPDQSSYRMARIMEQSVCFLVMILICLLSSAISHLLGVLALKG